MSTSNSDSELFETIRTKLNTALIGDILDTLGYERQFLPPSLRPLNLADKIVGRAMTVLEAEYSSISPSPNAVGPLAKAPFGLMMQALDSLQPGEIYMAGAASLGPPLPFAFWGGLMSTRAQHCGAVGAIVNGYVRDVDEIERLGFPVWSVGMYSRDQGTRGKVIDYRCRIQIGEAVINPGDLIVADKEGVLVIPREVEEKCVNLALEKAEAENGFAEAVKGGMSVVDAFHKFGVM